MMNSLLLIAIKHSGLVLRINFQMTTNESLLWTNTGLSIEQDSKMGVGENSRGLVYQMLNYGCLNLSYQMNINHFADVSKMVGAVLSTIR